MKVTHKLPVPEVRMVKPDPASLDYEFWVLLPVRVGGAAKTAHQEVVCDDGTKFINLDDACNHVIGKSEYASLLGQTAPVRKSMSLTGLELMTRGAWLDYCKANKIDPQDIKALQRKYVVTAKELESLRGEA